MRCDKKFYFIGKQSKSDGMGGSINTIGKGSSFMAHSTPVKAEIVLKEYGIVTTTARRLITKDNIKFPLESLTLTDGKLTYKVIEALDYKMKILLIESVGEWNED